MHLHSCIANYTLHTLLANVFCTPRTSWTQAYHEEDVEVGLQSLASLNANKWPRAYHRLEQHSSVWHLLETEVWTHVSIALQQCNTITSTTFMNNCCEDDQRSNACISRIASKCMGNSSFYVFTITYKLYSPLRALTTHTHTLLPSYCPTFIFKNGNGAQVYM